MSDRIVSHGERGWGVLERTLAAYGHRLSAVSQEAVSPPLAARVNHGRWIADCDRCEGAELLIEPGWILCVSCVVTGESPTWRRVILPSKRKDIETILMDRPLHNRNWEPRESPADLQAENDRMLVEVK